MVFGVETTRWYDDNAEGFAGRTRDLGIGRLNELPQVFGRLGRALKPGGALYASFKLGYGERTDASTGRHFTDLTEAELRELVKSPTLSVLALWIDADNRPGYDVAWLNMLLQQP